MEILRKVQVHEEVSEAVAKELGNVRRFNDVLRQQLNSITEETEQAAFTMTEKLQAIDSIAVSYTHLNY